MHIGAATVASCRAFAQRWQSWVQTLHRLHSIQALSGKHIPELVGDFALIENCQTGCKLPLCMVRQQEMRTTGMMFIPVCLWSELWIRGQVHMRGVDNGVESRLHFMHRREFRLLQRREAEHSKNKEHEVGLCANRVFPFLSRHCVQIATTEQSPPVM